MTPALLEAVGRALYGEYWRDPLAADLGVSVRSVQRWAAGEFNIPEGIAGDCKRILVQRRADIGKLIDRL
jgi:hypothetical protein